MVYKILDDNLEIFPHQATEQSSVQKQDNLFFFFFLNLLVQEAFNILSRTAFLIQSAIVYDHILK